uniref:Uncharacterized protein n=1 Tax=Amphimedon queenslandica TaxID=400682 RepID=A0A1X7VX36_AMPQE
MMSGKSSFDSLSQIDHKEEVLMSILQLNFFPQSRNQRLGQSILMGQPVMVPQI